MKAVKVFEHGNPDVLKYVDTEEPKISSGEVLIKVKGVALNHLDIWTRKGLPNVKIPLPITPGCDISGEVVEVGSDCNNCKVGDRVMFAPGVSCGACSYCLSGEDNLCNSYKILGYLMDGGYAEYAKAPFSNIIPIPDNLDYVQAASIPLVFMTAWHMLVTRAKVKPGETVLVHAAGSGVGIAGIQIAKLFGARVITTAGSDEKLQKAKELGADDLINYNEQDFAKEVRILTGKRGVDLVFEHIGGSVFEKSVSCMAKNGRIVTCGSTEGIPANIDLRALFYKHLTFYGSFMGSKGELFEVMKFFKEGKLKAVLDCLLPLKEAKLAHEIIEKRKQFGKVVLSPELS